MNIICDLDGTIALDHGRAQYLHTPKCPKHKDPGGHHFVCTCAAKDRDWDSYFAACDSDVPNRPVIEILHRFQISHKIYILSGRSHSVLDKTLLWLMDNHVPFDRLQMRGTEDRTDDDKLKLGWANFFDLRPTNTLFVLEDRSRVVLAWRTAGFTCFQVAPGDF